MKSKNFPVSGLEKNLTDKPFGGIEVLTNTSHSMTQKQKFKMTYFQERYFSFFF